MKTMLISLLVITASSACTWVELNDLGRNVAIVTSNEVRHCKSIADVSAKTRNQLIGDSTRNTDKVATELSILARNAAAKINANTIVAVSPPRNGEQVFQVFNCPTK
ncbi:MAG: hypothetical protein ACI9NY_000226 [Kiritimatiellia bacterium]|jgi:hypothetical protein